VSSPGTTDPDVRRRRRWWPLVAAGVLVVLVVMTVARACSGSDVRYRADGDVCAGVPANPTAAVYLPEIQRRNDVAAIAGLKWSVCRIALRGPDSNGLPPELIVGVAVQDSVSDALNAWAQTREAFGDSATGDRRQTVEGLGDEAFFGSGTLQLTSSGSLVLGGAAADRVLAVRDGNLAVLVHLHAQAGTDQVQPALIGIARDIMAHTPREA
jgi:hypothetical protein